jgi:hypothetical protein
MNTPLSATSYQQALASFHNTLVEEFPDLSIAALQFKPLEKRYTKAKIILRSSILLFISLLIALIANQPWLTIEPPLLTVLHYASPIIAILVVPIALLSYIADKHKGYCIRTHDISYQSGIIFTKVVTQPIVRIQHVELKQNIIERKLDLASLQVFSAGGAMHTFILPGINLTTAQQIRQHILQHTDETIIG